MFLPPEEIDRTTLRQGDVIAGISLLGALNLNGILTTSGADGQVVSFGFNKRLETGHVAVLSHCCEIDVRNDVKLTSIILAPLRDIDSATSPDKVQELIDTNIIGPRSEASYLKYFYLAPNDALQSRRGNVVDFSKCFSVRKQVYGTLMQKKAAQLDDPSRASFSLKLALFFHRDGALAPAAQQGREAAAA